MVFVIGSSTDFLGFGFVGARGASRAASVGPAAGFVAPLTPVIWGAGASDSPGSVDRALERLGKERRIALRVSHFLMVPVLIAETDLVAAISRRAAEPFAKALGLRLFPPPVALPTSRIRQVWSEGVDTDPGHRFVRETLVRVASRV